MYSSLLCWVCQSALLTPVVVLLGSYGVSKPKSEFEMNECQPHHGSGLVTQHGASLHLVLVIICDPAFVIQPMTAVVQHSAALGWL